MNNKKLVIGTLLLIGIFFVIMFSQNSSSVGEVTVCAEKTLSGFWCLDVPEDQADSRYRIAPTSCESTSYCKPGTCVNTLEGLCMSNTAQKVCEDSEATGGIAAGVWYDQEPSELNQCKLGCCLIGDQASFTTQARCNQLSSVYRLESNYRTDISTETACIASASPRVKGACVFEEEFQRTCRFTTKEECQNLESSGKQNVEFNAGLLCSATELSTNCGPSRKTALIDGRDEVFFVDTCGNPANIYDADLQNNPNYWNEIVPKSLSCGAGSPNGNAGSRQCGNCDYFLGSTGKRYDRARDGAQSPNFGDYLCADLSCGNVDNSQRDHGESWCVNSASSTNLNNAPGSRYFRKICYNAEVTIEPCADFRQEVCIEDSIGEFSTAACRVNKWQDCVAQDNQKDCTNIDRRDCVWAGGAGEGEIGNSRCLPTNYPGFDFWNPETDATELCFQASASCEVKFEKGLSGALGELGEAIGGAGEEWICVENCECAGLPSEGGLLDYINLDNPWTRGKNNVCIALGDCGVSVNSVNDGGYYEIEDITKSIAP